MGLNPGYLLKYFLLTLRQISSDKKDNSLNLGLPVLDLRLKYGDSKIPIYMLMQSTGKEDCFHAEVSLSILHNPCARKIEIYVSI